MNGPPPSLPPTIMTLKEILRQVYPVSDKCADRLSAYARKCRFARRQRLVQQGEPCKYVYFVTEGLCRALYEQEDKEDTRWFASEGDVLTSVTAWHTGEQALFSIEAITPVECWSVPFEDMRELINTDREICAWAFRILMEQLYVLERRYIIIGTGDATSRYAALMRGRLQEMMNSIPLKYIAQYLNITQETLSRVRKQYALQHPQEMPPHQEESL